MKNNFKFLFACLLLGSGVTYAQVGVGTTTPNASSMLEITSTTKGFLMPRMTTAERTDIATPATGLQVYDTTTNSYWYYNGTAWSVNSDEWTYNGTDAIEATRALAGGNKFSITDSGNVYQSLGNMDWTTMSADGGATLVFNSNPIGKLPLIKNISTDAMNISSPITNPSTSIFGFDLSTFLIKQSHLAGPASSKRYIGNSTSIVVDASTTSPLSELNSGYFYVSNVNSASNISQMYGLRSIADHRGSGTVASNFGGSFISRLNSSGGIVTNLKGIYVAAGSQSVATGSLTDIKGIESFTYLQGSGTTGTMTGILNTVNLASASIVPTNTYGLYNNIGINSTSSTLSANAFGTYQGLNNLSPTKFSNLKGHLVSTSNGTTGGAPTNFVSIDNYLLNSATSTDPIALISGYNASVTHNGNSSAIANLYGINSSTTLGSASTGTVTNLYGIRINQVKNVASTTTITNNFGLYLDPVIASSGNNYSIYSNGGKSYFKDKLLINTTTLTDAMLNVNGAIQVGAYTGGTPVAGMIRFNSTTSKFQGYDGTAWQDLH